MKHLLVIPCCWALAFASEEKPVASDPAESTPKIHLYMDGQWGMDSDIYIFPDGTYSYHTYSEKDRKTVRKLEGKLEGLFSELVLLVDQYEAWGLTSESLKADLENAQKGSAMGVADASHYYLTIKTEKKNLKADFYAPRIFSEEYPAAQKLAVFSYLTRTIISRTERREPQR